MSQPSPLRAALRAGDALLKSNEAPHALKVVADALRGLALSPAEVDKAGRWLRKALSSPSAPPPSLRVYLLGQITTSWLTTALMAEALQRGALIWVDEAGYDQILQESLRPIEADVVVLLPWSKRLVEGADAAAERVALEVGFWRQVWANLEAQAVGRALRLIQVGYDLVSAGAEGVAPAGAPGGALDRVAQVNAALRAALPSSAYFLDLGYLAGEHGRRAFYDPRRYHWTKQPFSELGVVALAAALWAGVRALLTGPKKVLVLDLDNTLWGGVVGDEGPLGIVVGGGPDGEAFAAFQRHCKALSARGVLLAVASKNHPEDAREPFEVNPEMQLRLSDFAAFEASWAPKSLSLTHMAQTLRLGLDAFVFFDDNPAERALIQAHLPEVEVVDVPPDPAEYIRALEAGRWFEAAQITTADQARAAQYQLEGARRALEAEAGSLDDYLASLQMRGAVADLHDA
ncbi:HAD-IIIC family phosphatase, partial [Myxococcota bacterium]|nr:HAD-IIIC family phosphatase [Myxococcota bacterium]